MLTTIGTWDVLEIHGRWILEWEGYGQSISPKPDLLCVCSECTQIVICPSTFPRELAIDAALEFMDRYIEQRFSREISTEEQAMKFCFQNARRQR